MHHAARQPPLAGAQQLQRVAVRLADVQDHRQIQLPCRFELPQKNLLLNIPRHIVPMVIQPDFPPCLDAGQRSQALHLLHRLVGALFRIARMNAHRRVKIAGMGLRQLHRHAIHAHIGPDGHAGRDALLLHARDDRFPILVVPRVVQMRVRIKKHCFASSLKKGVRSSHTPFCRFSI